MPNTTESRVLATGQWAASSDGGGVVTMMAAATTALADDSEAIINANANSTSQPPVVAAQPPPPAQEAATSPNWHVGQIVLVKARTWPGINRPGGHGKISHVHHMNDDQETNNNKVIAVDVRYTMGGCDKHLDLSLVQPYQGLQRLGRDRRQRQVFTVNETTTKEGGTKAAARRSRGNKENNSNSRRRRLVPSALQRAQTPPPPQPKKRITAKKSPCNKKKPRNKKAIVAPAPAPPPARRATVAARRPKADNRDDDDDDDSVHVHRNHTRREDGYGCGQESSIVTTEDDYPVPQVVYVPHRSASSSTATGGGSIKDAVSPMVAGVGAEDRRAAGSRSSRNYMLSQAQRMRQAAENSNDNRRQQPVLQQSGHYLRPWDEDEENDDDDDFASIDEAEEDNHRHHVNEATCRRASVLGGGQVSQELEERVTLRQAGGTTARQGSRMQVAVAAASAPSIPQAETRTEGERPPSDNDDSADRKPAAAVEQAEQQEQESSSSGCGAAADDVDPVVDERRDLFVSSFHRLLEMNDGVIPEENLGTAIGDELRKSSSCTTTITEYNVTEVNAYLALLSSQNKIMRAEGLIYSTS